MPDSFTEYFNVGNALRQRAREEQLRNILSRQVKGAPASAAIGADPSAQPTPDSFNAAGAIPELARAGLGPEAIKLDETVNGPARDRQKLILEYGLKRALEQGRLSDAQQWYTVVQNGGQLPPGATISFDHNGLKLELDPAKAAASRRDDAKAGFEFGYQPGTPAPSAPGPQATPAEAPAVPTPARPTAPAPAASPGMTPKQQSELAAKRTEKAPEDLNRLSALSNDMDRLAAAADELANHPGLGSSTGAKAALGYIPNTDAYSFRAALESLKAKTAFNALGNLRAQSSTGGALGQVSNFEEQMLQNYISSLDRGQSPQDIQKSLQDIAEFARASKARLADTYTKTYGVRPQIKSYDQYVQETGGKNPAAPRQAPASAIQYLKNNNNPAVRAQFKAKYGYLPPGY